MLLYIFPLVQISLVVCSKYKYMIFHAIQCGKRNRVEKQ